MSSAPISQADPQLQLTPLEKELFGHVLACCRQLNPSPEVRVAGGWVRDKLLGLESDDIDLALDIMSGEEFALSLSEYMRSVGAQVSSMGVIKVNPEQSKHLATATLKLLDVSVDINNFRAEIYEPNSRIPTVERSTAKEDALRRDFTVNALFYNIHTGKVEDHVGGLDDLRARVLRTPRDPHKTFSDDPLRILRAARFAARFGFKVHEDITHAALVPQIQRDLAQKVSRERMGIEVNKMVRMYDRALQAFTLLCEQWHLRRIVFEVPEQFERAPESEIGLVELEKLEVRAEAAEHAGLTEACLEGMKVADMLVRHERLTGEDASMLLLAAFLRPYFGYRTEQLKDGKPSKGLKRYSTLVWYVVRESLRLTQHDATLASDLLAHAYQLIKTSNLHAQVATAPGAVPATATAAAATVPEAAAVPVLTPTQRLQLVTGTLLRQTGASTPIALLLAEVILMTARIPALSAACSFDVSLGAPAEHATATYVYDAQLEISVRDMGRFRRYREWIASSSHLLDLQVWKMTPLVAGTDPQLCALLGIPTKGGPHIGQIVQRMLEWQIINADKMLAARNAALSNAPAPAAAAASSVPAAITDEQLKAECFAWVARYKHTFEVPPERGAKAKK